MRPTRRLVASLAPWLLLGCRRTAAAPIGAAALKETAMGHVVLLGDSIFDNKSYVGRDPDVIAQLRARLGQGWRATLLAVDGDVTDNVRGQLAGLPKDATHLVISVGGNDALGASGILTERAGSVAEAVARLAEAQDRFRRSYLAMVEAVAAAGLPTALCTIYDANYPEPQGRLVRAGLTLFNDVITRAAVSSHLALIDLRLIASEPADYANPIEPSAHGGDKITRAIEGFVRSSAQRRARTEVWT